MTDPSITPSIDYEVETFQPIESSQDMFEGGVPNELVVTKDTVMDASLQEEINRIGKDYEEEWVKSLNSAACGPWWNKQINMELFEGSHTPPGKKHLFKKCDDGSGQYHLDGDVILKFGKVKSHEQMKDTTVDIGDWIRWFGVFVYLKSGLYKIFNFRMTTTTDKGGFIHPRMQGYHVVVFAKPWTPAKITFTSAKQDSKIIGMILGTDTCNTWFRNQYDGKDDDHHIHCRTRNLVFKDRGDQIIIDLHFSELQGMKFPGLNSYKFFKQMSSIVMNAPTELGNKATDIYLPTKLFERFWGRKSKDQLALTLDSEFKLAQKRRGRKLQRCKLVNVMWMSEIGNDLKASGLVKALNDRFVMTEVEWNTKIDGWY